MAATRSGASGPRPRGVFFAAAGVCFFEGPRAAVLFAVAAFFVFVRAIILPLGVLLDHGTVPRPPVVLRRNAALPPVHRRAWPRRLARPACDFSYLLRLRAADRPSKPGRWGQDLDQSGDRLTVQNYTVRRLIREAYGLKSDSQIIGGPGWIDDRRFDIIAKVDDAEAARMSKMTGEQSDKEWALMLQSLLADRFQLRVTREERTLPVYALIVARSGPKIKRAPEHRADSQDGDPGIEIDWSELTARAASMEAFADSLTSLRDLSSRVVLNRTGLVGDYDFKLDWARDRGDGASQDSPYPALFEALPEQLGLRLKAERAAVEVVIVEAAKAPTGN